VGRDLSKASKDTEEVKVQLRVKAAECDALREQLAAARLRMEAKAAVEGDSIVITGDPVLGATLRVSGGGAAAAAAAAQWHRQTPTGSFEV
jgi:phage baseplate assembly protein gpV